MFRHRRLAALVLLATAGTLALSACSSSKGGGSTSSSSGASSSASSKPVIGYNAGNTSVVNASTKPGGTVKYELSDAPDSFDPGNTYYAFMWDFSRLYARPLVTFETKPGADGLKLVPDLATSLGTPSNGGKTWTYTLRQGVKYQDGTEVTSADVKYAVERSNYAPAVISNGPTYFNANLVDNPTPYAGPYKDPTGNLASIQTPDKYTIVFNLKAPFADFDYLVSNPQTAPVPQAKDTGADYVKAIQSTGPYMFKSYVDGKSAVLIKNPNWSATTDPLRTQLPNEIDITMGVEQATVDQDLLAGSITSDMTGAGVLAATQPAVLTDPAKKANADDALSGALVYMAVNTTVKPFDNLDCRKAVEYAVDKLSVQNVLGGPVRGQIATTLLPPNVTGYTKFDMYPSTNESGDIAKAKDELTKCGQPNGFTTSLSARSDRPNEINAATSIQASLKKVGINVTIQQYPSGKYFSDFAGAPAFGTSHDLGLMMSAWAADWPTGYGFLDQIIDGATIKASGNTNLSSLNDPNVNSMLNAAIQNTDTNARNKAWGDIDKATMADAAIVPLTYRLDLLYRPPNATNVYVTPAYGMYDYLTMGSSTG
jgi:peptide/nickel transport system substrate-binding protein